MRHVPGPQGSSLAVHDLGDGRRPTLLCHATGFHGAVWEPFAGALGDGFDRWSLDFRAHGASAVPEGQALDWEGFGDDVLAVVDALGLLPGEILGIGHSMGGAALLLAEQRRPGTFAGLWLYEPVTFPPEFAAVAGGEPGPNRLAEGAARRRPTFPSRAAALENYAAKPPFAVLRADALHAYVRHGFVPDDAPDAEPGSVRLACRPADESQIYRGGPAHGAFAHLGDVACPVVIAHGDDVDGPARIAPVVAAALPAGRIEDFGSLSHFGPLEAPGLTAGAAEAFAATL